MPGGKKLAGANPSREREYEAIKLKTEAAGKSVKASKELAARIVNSQRAKAGETKES